MGAMGALPGTGMGTIKGGGRRWGPTAALKTTLKRVAVDAANKDDGDKRSPASHKALK